MIENLTAWWVAAGVGVVLLVVLLLTTRHLKSPVLRGLLCLLPVVWFTLPVEIPLHAGHYAPALVVALFESVLQADGNPTAAFTVLAAGTLISVAIVLVIGLTIMRKPLKNKN